MSTIKIKYVPPSLPWNPGAVAFQTGLVFFWYNCVWFWNIHLSIVILFLTSYPTAREALLVAFNESMVNGEYAFIIFMKDVDEVERNLKHQFKWYISHHTETLHTTKEVKKALDAALILAPKLPEASYSTFVNRLRTTMGHAPFFSKSYIGRINGTHMNKSLSQVTFSVFFLLVIRLSTFFTVIAIIIWKKWRNPPGCIELLTETKYDVLNLN